MARTIALVAGAATFLSGCWLQVGYDRGHTRFNDLEDQLTAANAATLNEDWSVDLGTALSEPMVRDGKVFVATGGMAADGRLTAGAAALSAVDGSTVWSKTHADFCCSGLGTGSFSLPVPVTFVGDELWTGRTTIAFGAPGQVLYRSVASPVRLDPTDGSLIAEVRDEYSGDPSVDAGDRVVVTSRGPVGPQVMLLDEATLAVAWTAGLPSTAGFMRHNPPAVAGGQVFVVTGPVVAAYPLACADPCPPAWTADLGANAGPLVAPATGSSLFTVAGTELIALDRATGAVTWRGALGAASPGIAVTPDTVYVGAGTTLLAFPAAGCGAATCTPTGSAPLAAAATSSPVVAGGVVYVGEVDGIEAFTADSALDPVAHVPVTGQVEHLSVAAGRLFAVSRSGTQPTRITAFAPA